MKTIPLTVNFDNNRKIGKVIIIDNEIEELIKKGNYKLEIGYIPTEWEEDEKGNRIMKEIDLQEISLVFK